MTEITKTIFISDLHLAENQPQITKQFLDLLSNTKTPYVDAIYILGDLFEAWIGDDDASELNIQIMQALQTVTQKNIPIYILHGNRDFLLSNQFFKMTGCQFIPDETVINVYGESVLLMHGDTLCTSDLQYMKVRKLMRNRLLQKFFLSLPLHFRQKIASGLRNKSMTYTQKAPKEIMDVTQSEVEKVMLKHHVNVLIHGHTHQPQIHAFTLNGEPATRIVLGAWHERGNMLMWDKSGKKEWKEM